MLSSAVTFFLGGGMALSIIAFGVFLGLSFGITAAIVNDVFFDEDDEADAEAPRELDELRAVAIATDDPLSFALGLSESEATTLLDETQLDGVLAQAEAALLDAPIIRADDLGSVTGIGTEGDDVFRAGDDIVAFDSQLGGNDIISAADGPDARPSFLIFAGAGDDVILGAPNVATQTPATTGIGGNDVIFADAGEDIIFAGDGDDQIFGESGSDILLGGAGDDKFNEFGDGTDFTYAGSGDDVISRNPEGPSVQPGLEVVNAGAGNDTVSLTIGTTLVALGDGQDRLDILNLIEDRDDDPIAVVTDFVPGEDQVVLGAYAPSPDANAGNDPVEIGIVIQQVSTNQGPALLVLPDLSGLPDVVVADQVNVSGAILVGIGPEDLQDGDVRAVLLDGSVDRPFPAFKDFVNA